MSTTGEVAVFQPATRKLAMPERVSLALRDYAGPATPLPLPSQRTWPAGIVIGVFFVIFAGIALQTISSMRTLQVANVFDLMLVAFQGFWVLGWSVGVAVLFLLTVGFLFFRERAQVAPRHLVHTARLGLVRVISEYDLAKMRNVRAEGPSGSDLVRIRFDYGDAEHTLGNQMSRDTAALCIRLMNSAVASMDRSIATSADEPAPGIELTGLLRRGELRRRSQTLRDAEPAPHGVGSEAGSQSASSASFFAQIAANIVPLAGVMFFDWSLGDIMVLFWAETAVIGCYNILKIAMVARWGAVFVAPFFVGHYGGFMAAHFLFIYYLFVHGVDNTGPDAAAGVAMFTLFAPLWPALLMLVLSHGVSYVTNFLGRREYEGRTSSQQMQEPYKRIVIMHLTIIFGGWIALLLHSPVPALATLVALKTTLDLRR